MTAEELRKKYLNFFRSKNHEIINSAPLVPENDPTVLFTTAGMHPLVPFLLGEKHPAGSRLTNVQRCIRTGDIEEVGDNSHLTFFEMLGNWSLGDYFKVESIHYSWEFLTKELKLDKDRIAISCYAGSDIDGISKDEEACKIWLDLGIDKDKIVFLDDNWWGPAGETGPCGPDTEIFYWAKDSNPPKKFDPNDQNWIEIWNNVFMQYQKTKQGKFIPLAQKNVDTGMGLERVLAILNKKDSVYDTEIFTEIIDLIKNDSDNFDEKSARIIADHVRAATMMITDGIEPSNLDQGYVLRRLIRRSIRHAKLISIKDSKFLSDISKNVFSIYKTVYEIKMSHDDIEKILIKEYEKFNKALETGQKEFSKIVNQLKQHNQDTISGRLAFRLYESYGFPYEITEELAKEEGFTIDKVEFDKAYEKHQLLSRKGAEKKFSGGLADHSEKVTKYHTATHLLHQALRQVLGEHVGQKGSNITADRLRFDFTHKDKLTDEQKKQVEDLVNDQIKAKLPVRMQEMDLATAKTSGALGFFESKYGKIVKVYTIGHSDRDFFSREICGGPHIKNTSELGHFMITSEKSSSSGIRRIKAILE